MLLSKEFQKEVHKERRGPFQLRFISLLRQRPGPPGAPGCFHSWEPGKGGGPSPPGAIPQQCPPPEELAFLDQTEEGISRTTQIPSGRLLVQGGLCDTLFQPLSLGEELEFTEKEIVMKEFLSCVCSKCSRCPWLSFRPFFCGVGRGWEGMPSVCAGLTGACGH